VADRPRLLARQAGKRHPQQYTSSTAAALSHEPEAIPEEEQARISDEARRRWQVIKGEELARKQTRSRLGRLRQRGACASSHKARMPPRGRSSTSRLGRLRQVESRARTKSIDIYRHVAAIDREIALAEQLVDGAS
jgi:hypothetical protein